LGSRLFFYCSEPHQRLPTLFDYSAALSQVIADIAESCPEFAHIHPRQVWVAIAQCRTSGVHGTYASVLPLRFENGARETTHRGIRVTRQPLFDGEHEILYIITFYLPRFCDLSFDQKLKTIFHELYHINPDFNGDVRRLTGGKYAHGSSRKAYDKRIEPSVQSYLETRRRDAELLEFLHFNFAALVEAKGRVVGRRVNRRRAGRTAAPP